MRTDALDELAARLGWETRDLADVIGAGWRRSEATPDHDFDLDPSGGLDPDDLLPLDVTPWHVAGDPAQLMARVFAHGVFLASPEGVWAGGTHGLEHRPGPPVYVPAHELSDRGPEVVRGIVAGRRRSFRWCRYCRSPQAPETRWEPDVCHGCASSWLGVVY
ncbi:hypothetical protein ENKNEFLB_03858 [Nocardioides aquaticus]|uniref:Uncharacterized protein n=1 Tax=Nocardioides aquaticus TaxID=160826 RepID=A0ABX8ELQ2_9ACTN|nr:hypothetical protein [Nocardioides aquaticus]QVT81448.1 hypothetical protein ENKNEFLB_03858 [Nocardioides aquaticus]